MILVMLMLGGAGWLMHWRLDLFERIHAVTGSPETLQSDGVIVVMLLLLLGASLDTYRRYQQAVRERERLRAMIDMARAATHESHDPLTLIIANIETVISEMHPGHDAYDRLRDTREAAWTMARRLKDLTEVRDAEELGPLVMATRPPLFDLPR
jgi:hypothetical protein